MGPAQERVVWGLVLVAIAALAIFGLVAWQGASNRREFKEYFGVALPASEGERDAARLAVSKALFNKNREYLEVRGKLEALEQSILATKVLWPEDLVRFADKKREARALVNNADKIKKAFVISPPKTHRLIRTNMSMNCGPKPLALILSASSSITFSTSSHESFFTNFTTTLRTPPHSSRIGK